MKRKPQVTMCLDEALLEDLIESAERTVVYAAPSISVGVAEAIVRKKSENSQVSINIVVDPGADPLRLGFGEISGLKMLQLNEIDIRCQPGLRIGIVIVDDRSWIFAPTPEIILEKPEPGTINAINVSSSFTAWLMRAISPRQGYLDRVEDLLDEYRSHLPSDLQGDEEPDSDDGVLDDEIIEKGAEHEDPVDNEAGITVADIQPEIGTQTMPNGHILKIEDELESNPPRQFDHAREMLVYNGYLQFVDMKFTGGRLSARTISLPKDLLEIVDDKATQVEIRASCRIFESPETVCQEITDFEKRVGEVRRCYTKPLGNDLGSVILAKDRAGFDQEIDGLHKELDALSKVIHERLEGKLNESRNRLVQIFLPLLCRYPSKFVRGLVEHYANPGEAVLREVEYEIGRCLPTARDLLGEMDLRCTFKDVTWEMLNEKEFGNAIREKFPDEKFTRLHQERQAIGERTPKQKREISNEDWPDELDTEPNAH